MLFALRRTWRKLSCRAWRNRFGKDPGILGRTIVLDGIQRRVVGIAPASFSFPSTRVQLWIPTRIDPRDQEDYWGGAFVPLIARLRPGAGIEQARGEIRALAAGIWKLFPRPMPRRWNADSTVISLQTDLAGETRGKLFVLLGAVGTLLLIACANVASLLLARATSRRKEIALRAALGAGRGRIIRQLLTESVVLALAAGAAGMLLGTAAISLLRSIVPSDMPGFAQIGLDWRVAAFAVALSILTGLSFGIVPALSAGTLELLEAMKTGSQRSTSSGWMAFRSCLIGGEIALTLVLLAGAGLLMKSLYDLTSVNPGFNSKKYSRSKSARAIRSAHIVRRARHSTAVCWSVYAASPVLSMRPLRTPYRSAVSFPCSPPMLKIIREQPTSHRPCCGPALSAPTICV